MALLNTNDQSFRWQPIVFEMKDHIAMGGKIYDKSTLARIPFKTLQINIYSRVI
jgi:hypothetical protein